MILLDSMRGVPAQYDASTMEFFHEKVNGWKPLSNSAKSSIKKARLGFKYISEFCIVFRFGQSNKFKEKRKVKFRDIHETTPQHP